MFLLFSQIDGKNGGRQAVHPAEENGRQDREESSREVQKNGASKTSLEHGAKLLKSLRSGHILLFDAMEHINEMYKMHIFISTFTSMSKILFNLYFSIFGFITSSNSLPTRVQVGQLYIVSMWTGHYCIRFFIMVCFAHLACAESREARKIVSKIDPETEDPDFRQEVKMFSDHLSGRDFEFSACGFFKLNMSLITSTFSVGITYLVIMAQLR